jgi:stage V sporulation protein AE
VKPAASLSGARFGKEPAAGSGTGAETGQNPKNRKERQGRTADRRSWRIVQNQKERKGDEKMLAMFFWAFVVGGIICVIGQLLMDVCHLTPGHTLSLLVVAGAILDGFDLYEPLIDFAGAGATVPITSFGNSLVHGALEEVKAHGIIGVLTGMFEVTSSGISSAIIFAFIGALIFKSKG